MECVVSHISDQASLLRFSQSKILCLDLYSACNRVHYASELGQDVVPRGVHPTPVLLDQREQPDMMSD